MTDKELDEIITLLTPKQTGNDHTLQGLRAKSPFKAKPKRKGTGRPQGRGTGSTFNTPINRQLNTDRTDSYAVEFSIKNTFWI